METIFSIFFVFSGMITGIIGLVISILGYNHNKIEAVSTYFDSDKDQTFIDGRRLVYNLPKDETITEDSDENLLRGISSVANNFNHAGLLVRKKQLPFWVFYSKETGITASGIAIVRTYNKLKPTIKYFRKKNPKYASNYEWLYEKIISVCPEYKNYTK